jgi:hypothetical protein
MEDDLFLKGIIGMVLVGTFGILVIVGLALLSGCAIHSSAFN